MALVGHRREPQANSNPSPAFCPGTPVHACRRQWGPTERKIKNHSAGSSFSSSHPFGPVQVVLHSVALPLRDCCLGCARSCVCRPREPFCRADLRGHSLGATALARQEPRTNSDPGVCAQSPGLEVGCLFLPARLLVRLNLIAACADVPMARPPLRAPSAREPGRY